MNDWLSEIENEISFLRKNDAMGRKADFQRERMARVLRELIRYIRVLRSTDDSRERLIAYNNLPPDAKELLK